MPAGQSQAHNLPPPPPAPQTIGELLSQIVAHTFKNELHNRTISLKNINLEGSGIAEQDFSTLLSELEIDGEAIMKNLRSGNLSLNDISEIFMKIFPEPINLSKLRPKEEILRLIAIDSVLLDYNSNCPPPLRPPLPISFLCSASTTPLLDNLMSLVQSPQNQNSDQKLRFMQLLLL